MTRQPESQREFFAAAQVATASASFFTAVRVVLLLVAKVHGASTKEGTRPCEEENMSSPAGHSGSVPWLARSSGTCGLRASHFAVAGGSFFLPLSGESSSVHVRLSLLTTKIIKISKYKRIQLVRNASSSTALVVVSSSTALFVVWKRIKRRRECVRATTVSGDDFSGTSQ